MGGIEEIDLNSKYGTAKGSVGRESRGPAGQPNRSCRPANLGPIPRHDRTKGLRTTVAKLSQLPTQFDRALLEPRVDESGTDFLYPTRKSVASINFGSSTPSK
jgi:hypothetical protein